MRSAEGTQNFAVVVSGDGRRAGGKGEVEFKGHKAGLRFGRKEALGEEEEGLVGATMSQ